MLPDERQVLLRWDQKIPGKAVSLCLCLTALRGEVHELCLVVAVDDMGNLMEQREPKGIGTRAAKRQAEDQLPLFGGIVGNALYESLNRGASEVSDHLEPDAASGHDALQLLHSVVYAAEHQGSDCQKLLL